MTNLHFEKKGNGQPIVLIHSGGTDIRDWEFITPSLSKEFEVISYDARGAGQSPVTTEPTNHVVDLEDLINFLDIQKAILIGHSLGGQIATDFTLKNPEKVEKLVLIAPGLTGFEFDLNYQKMASRIWEVVPDVDKMMNIMLNTPECYAVQEGMKSPQKNLIVKIHRDNIEKSLSWKNFDQIWSEPPSIDRLKEIKTETLFILGKEDKEDLFKIQRLFKQLPNIKFEEITNADHILTLTHPNEIIELIMDFVKG